MIFVVLLRWGDDGHHSEYKQWSCNHVNHVLSATFATAFYWWVCNVVRCFTGAQATDKHVSVEVELNSSIVLQCETNSADLKIWYYNSPSSNGQSITVYNGESVRGKRFTSRHKLIYNKTAEIHNLVISDVEMQDVGTYICTLDEGLAKHFYLNVTRKCCHRSEATKRCIAMRMLVYDVLLMQPVILCIVYSIQLCAFDDTYICNWLDHEKLQIKCWHENEIDTSRDDFG